MHEGSPIKTSLRTILIVVFFCASSFAYAVAITAVGNHSEFARVVTALVSIVAMSIGASATCATIAFDRTGTRRSAERAAIYGFAGFVAFGILIGLALMPRVR